MIESIKCEMINRMIAIPQCIWNNFTGEDDYCRWIVYDTAEQIVEEGWKQRYEGESFGCKKLGFFNYRRGDKLSFEFVGELREQELETIIALAKQEKFIDYTDHEKADIRVRFANHPQNTSLMCGKDCPEAERLAILQRLVHLAPHPKDTNGQSIPMICDKHGNIVEWPKDKNGKRISVWELD